MEIINLDPRDCTRWKYADRNHFEFGDTEALALDIQTNGQINPVFVRKISNDPQFKYEVIAGSRRLKACLSANIKMSAILVDVPDDKAATIQIKENEQVPLSEYSKGLAFDKLKKDNKLTQEQLASLACCSRKKIFSLLTFAQVDPKIWQAVGNMSKVSAKSSETILAISKKSPEHKEALIEIAEEIKKGAGYKRIEQLVNAILLGATHTGEEEQITSKSWQVIGKWKDGKLLLNKDLAVDRKKLNKMLIEFFDKNID